jgi:hypothetical protein
VLLFPVVLKVGGKPQDNVRTVLEVGWRLGHLLTTGTALCRFGLQSMVVADGEFGDHSGILRSASRIRLAFGAKVIGAAAAAHGDPKRCPSCFGGGDE